MSLETSTYIVRDALFSGELFPDGVSLLLFCMYRFFLFYFFSGASLKTRKKRICFGFSWREVEKWLFYYLDGHVLIKRVC